MTRVYSHRTHRGAHRASVLDRSRAVRKKKPYKIVLEAITQEKKKLHSILSYTANAPPGYSFVPVGHPDLTEYCKERCRKRNLDVHVVSAKPRSKAHENPEKISHHVHRIGYHFPNEVISEACDVLGYQYRNGVYSKRVHNYDETRLARSLADHGQRMLLHGRPATDTESKTQIRAAVRDLFPKIPEVDLTSIVTHAFEEGSKRVGNAMQLSLARRVQLAVVAHIRHTYTDYDQLLKTISWMEARTQVEHVSLAKLREWRDEGDTNELEETFREVIIIDDDEDEESSDEDSYSETDQREPSLEIVSSRATARELQHNEPDDLVLVDVRSVGRAPRRTIFLPSIHPASRSSTVARTFNAYPTEQASRTYARPLPPVAPTRSPQEYHHSLHLAHSRPMDPRSRNSVVSRPQHPLQVRGEDGQLYNLQPIVESSGNTRLTRGNGVNTPYYTREEYIQPVPPVNQLESNPPSRFAPVVVSRRPSEQDIVIPSIERELEPVLSPRHIPDASYHSRQDRVSDVAGYPAATRDDTQRAKRKELTMPIYIYDGDGAYIEQVSKRPKPGYFQAEMSAPLRQPPAAISHQNRDYKDVHIRPQPPRHEVIDLTPSSPTQPPHSRGRDGHVVPTHSYITARPSNYSHVPGRSLNSYYEYPQMASPRAELPIPRMRDRDDIRDDLVRREPYRRPLAVESRATKGNLVYGYDVQ